jgi:hypothetical protein
LTGVPWVSPAEAQDYFDIVDVPLADVDVVVTDRRGRPVTDLDREDFRVLVDGQEQAIRRVGNWFSRSEGIEPEEGC